MKYKLLSGLLLLPLLLAACAANGSGLSQWKPFQEVQPMTSEYLPFAPGPSAASDATDAPGPSAASAATDAPATDQSPSRFGCDALFFGDSITCDSNFEDYFPALRIVNLGVYGDTLGDLLRRVPELRAEDPARIFLMGGINSLRPDNVDDCLAQYGELLRALRAACPRAELVVESVLPVGAQRDPDGSVNDAVRRFNHGLRLLAERSGLAYANIYSAYAKDGALDPALTRDGIHLNFTDYGPWAELLRPYLGNAGSAR